MRHHAKFCGNQPNRCSDMMIYRFFNQNAGPTPCWICYTCAWNFGLSVCAKLDRINVASSVVLKINVGGLVSTQHYPSPNKL